MNCSTDELMSPHVRLESLGQDIPGLAYTLIFKKF